MFKKIAITIIAASALLVSMQASAAGHGHSHHKRDAGINKEQREQAVMIQQGINTCQITPAEARTLKNTQKRIKRLEKKFKANGYSRWETQTLRNKLHAARVEINKLTKNRSNCRPKPKYRSHGHGYGASDNRRHDARNHSSNGRSGRSGRSGGSISVTVRNIH